MSRRRWPSSRSSPGECYGPPRRHLVACRLGFGVAGRDTSCGEPVKIEATRGDITTERVDAIVNAANTALRRGAGVCGAIFAAAGPELDAACAAIGACATGDAVITPGFSLPARWIVHTVGPVWHGGDAGEPALLASCYRRSIEVAREMPERPRSRSRRYRPGSSATRRRPQPRSRSLPCASSPTRCASYGS